MYHAYLGNEKLTEKHTTLVWKINWAQKYVLTNQLSWRKRKPQVNAPLDHQKEVPGTCRAPQDRRGDSRSRAQRVKIKITQRTRPYTNGDTEKAT